MKCVICGNELLPFDFLAHDSKEHPVRLSNFLDRQGWICANEACAAIYGRSGDGLAHFVYENRVEVASRKKPGDVREWAMDEPHDRSRAVDIGSIFGSPG